MSAFSSTVKKNSVTEPLAWLQTLVQMIHIQCSFLRRTQPRFPHSNVAKQTELSTDVLAQILSTGLSQNIPKMPQCLKADKHLLTYFVVMERGGKNPNGVVLSSNILIYFLVCFFPFEVRSKACLCNIYAMVQ